MHQKHKYDFMNQTGKANRERIPSHFYFYLFDKGKDPLPSSNFNQDVNTRGI